MHACHVRVSMLKRAAVAAASAVLECREFFAAVRALLVFDRAKLTWFESGDVVLPLAQL